MTREVIEAIERIVKNGGIAEVKQEPQGIVVVEISRKIKYVKKSAKLF